MELIKYDGDIGNIDFLNLMVIDISGKIRNVTLPESFVNEKVFNEGIGFDASNYGFAPVTNSDMVAVPDMDTAFVEFRDGYKTLHTLCDVRFVDGGLFDQYPRSVARNTTNYVKKKTGADEIFMLVELEFHVFDDVEISNGKTHASYRLHSEEGIGDIYSQSPCGGLQSRYHSTHPEDIYLDLRNEATALMTEIGVPVKYHHHEVSVCQMEIELDFMPLMKASDAVSIAMWIIRNCAQERGLHVTFMPKPMYNLAGNGMHVHQYLKKNGKSMFPGKRKADLNDMAINYTGGLIKHSLSGALLAFTNPSTNSFRRLVRGFEAPVSGTFAAGSRSAAVRIPGYASKNEWRVEYRTGDASANIYLMLSAMGLAGTDGILSEHDAEKSGYHSSDAKEKLFPLNLDAVLDGLQEDKSFLTAIFPEPLINMWIKRKRREAAYIYNAPTARELEIYF